MSARCAAHHRHARDVSGRPRRAARLFPTPAVRSETTTTNAQFCRLFQKCGGNGAADLIWHPRYAGWPKLLKSRKASHGDTTASISGVGRCRKRRWRGRPVLALGLCAALLSGSFPLAVRATTRMRAALRVSAAYLQQSDYEKRAARIPVGVCALQAVPPASQHRQRVRAHGKVARSRGRAQQIPRGDPKSPERTTHRTRVANLKKRIDAIRVRPLRRWPRRKLRRARPPRHRRQRLRRCTPLLRRRRVSPIARPLLSRSASAAPPPWAPSSRG